MLHLLAKCNRTLLPKSYNYLQSYIFITSFSASSNSSRNSRISSHVDCNSGRNISSNISLIEQQKKSSVEDLLVSCGFKSSAKHVSAVTFFKSFGFSDTQIKTVITKCPPLLSASISTILRPKIDFLRSVEFSEQDVIKIVTTIPYLLMSSLQNHLIPAFNFLKKYYGGQEIAVDKIKIFPSLFGYRVTDNLYHNVKTLRDFGVAETRVTKLITEICCLASAFTKPEYFRKVVVAITEMGFDPNLTSFEQAVHTMTWYTEANWLKKLEVYKSLGFSQLEINDMFKKQPLSLCLSEKKIRAAAKFYYEKLNWTPSHFAKYPNALMYSLDKRVVPRCSVLQLLVSKHRVENVNILPLLVMTENEFMEKYINKFKDEIPEVLDAYQGKIKFYDFNLPSFDHVVHAEDAWVKKLEVYKSLGFSEGELHDMFQKQPLSLCLSEKKIRAAAKFYFEKFNWSPSYLAKYPNALMYSLDKRVVPRCSVLQVLVSRNRVKKVNVRSLLVKTKNKFLEKYVNDYKDEIPEVLDAYQGKIKFDKFNIECI